MRAVELFEKLKIACMKNRVLKSLFGDTLTLVRDDSIKAYVFKKGELTTIGVLENVLKSDFMKNRAFEDYHVVGKLVNSFSSIKNLRGFEDDIVVSTYAEAGEQEPFDPSGDTTGIIDISWYGFWSNEVYRHSFSTACCNDFLGDSINRKKKFCACCGRKIDYNNIIKKEIYETA